MVLSAGFFNYQNFREVVRMGIGMSASIMQVIGDIRCDFYADDDNDVRVIGFAPYGCWGPGADFNTVQIVCLTTSVIEMVWVHSS